MRIALVTAFRSEAAPLLALMASAERRKVDGVSLWLGCMGPHAVTLAVCGAGPQRAAESLGRAAALIEDAELAVNFGVCGALDMTAALHEVVSMSSVAAVYHHQRRPLPLIGLPLPGVRDGALITHSRPVFDSRVAQRLARRFQAGYVDMEAWEVAAFFKQRSVPLAVVKAVSDHADEASAAGFSASARAASHKCALTVRHALLTL